MEFMIIGAIEGSGRDKGTVVWQCETEDGVVFNVRPAETREQRRVYWENHKKFIGSLLTVKFQEMTLKGVPRFPVGVGIRDYE